MSISANVDGENAKAFDYTTNSSIQGRMDRLFHYGESAAIMLKPNGKGSYRGHDYGTSSAFTVRVNRRQIVIYDYGEGAYFTYTG